MEVFSIVKRPEKTFEKVDQERITEQAGYISPEVQINRFIQAGRRLNEYRQEMYDFSDEKVDLDIDTSIREKSTDIAEISEMKLYIEEKLDKARKAVEDKGMAEKSSSEKKSESTPAAKVDDSGTATS